MSEEYVKHASIIDGKNFANDLCEKIKKQVEVLKEEKRLTPGLAVILIGENAASTVYVRNKVKRTNEVGMNSFEITLPADTSERNLIKKIESLNNDPKVHGILVQLPLPSHIDEKAVINSVAAEKDVDGFNVANVGKLSAGLDGMVPCTPLGCMMLLKSIIDDFNGLKAVVIGRSNIVGKPMAQLLLQHNCTVTIVHSKTKNIAEECKGADIIVAAVGIPYLVKGDWIKKGAVVIDVGINRIATAEGKSRLVGDVAFEEAVQVASAITPVPGGVGPMTIACLLHNTLKAACKQRNIEVPVV